jgi:hypothetical protein
MIGSLNLQILSQIVSAAVFQNLASTPTPAVLSFSSSQWKWIARHKMEKKLATHLARFCRN